MGRPEPSDLPPDSLTTFLLVGIGPFRNKAVSEGASEILTAKLDGGPELKRDQSTGLNKTSWKHSY